MKVLCYHKVNDRDADWNNITLSENTFLEQMQYLAANFTIGRSDVQDSGNLIITFDDGYEDVYTKIFPVLVEMGIPFTVFISTLRIDSDEEDWCNELSRLVIEGGRNNPFLAFDDLFFDTTTIENRKEANWEIFRILKKMNVANREKKMDIIRSWSGEEGKLPRRAFRMLNSKQIQELAQSSLVNIGFHTVNHPSLGYLSEEEQMFELVNSKRRIEDIIGKKITQFAYPFGGVKDYNAQTIEILDKLGVEKAYLTSERHNFNRQNLEIPRTCISECSYESFVKIVNE